MLDSGNWAKLLTVGQIHSNGTRILGLILHLKKIDPLTSINSRLKKKLFFSFCFVLAEETEASSFVGAAESQAREVSAKTTEY